MVALRDRDFPLALRLWREIRQAAEPTGAGFDWQGPTGRWPKIDTAKSAG